MEDELLDQEGHVLFANDRYIVRRTGCSSAIHHAGSGLRIPCRESSLIMHEDVQSLAFIDYVGELHHSIARPADLACDDDAVIEGFMEGGGDSGR